MVCVIYVWGIVRWCVLSMCVGDSKMVCVIYVCEGIVRWCVLSMCGG